jgi:hypothetical protein
LALARCVYRAVASKKHYAQEIVQLQQRLAVTWVLKSIGKSIGNLFFIVDVEARVMKPAATAASQSRGLIGPGTGTDIGPGTDRHQLVCFGRSM